MGGMGMVSLEEGWWIDLVTEKLEGLTAAKKLGRGLAGTIGNFRGIYSLVFLPLVSNPTPLPYAVRSLDR